MTTEFISYLHEVFAPFGIIQIRRMFGGFGLYHQSLMFGLVVDDTLYLKVDADSKPAYEKLQRAQFKFERLGKIIKMSYYQAPDEIFEDADQATLWARRAYKAALKAHNSKKKAL
jgi:DNA transformation protein